MTERRTVLNFLDAHADARICEYDQAGFDEKLSHRLRGKANSGYCAGVCIEWLRRVLQGGNKSLIPKKDKNKETRRLALTARTEMSMAVYLKVKARSEQPYTGGKFQERYEAAGAFISEVHGLLKGTSQHEYLLPRSVLDSFKLATGKSMAETIDRNDQKIERATLEACYNVMFDWEEKHLEALKTHMSDTRLPPAVLCWGDVHAKLDSYHNGIREQYGARSPTKRPFSGIRPLEDARGKDRQSTSPQRAILEAIGSDMFTQGRGMLFEVLTTDGGGHGQGVFREAERVYLHLDPNFGVWRCDKRQLAEQMQYLWVDGGDKKSGIYPDLDMVPKGMYRYSIWETVPREQ
jgi:hypothetical protein